MISNENVYEQIESLSENLQEYILQMRRDFHQFPEPGWLEVRTSSLIARELHRMGYEVLTGEDVCLKEARMGVPSRDVLDREYERALAQGADESFAVTMRDGMTGVIGLLKNGSGPTTALRFDLDALRVQESGDPGHGPCREGFDSVNEGYMHACGHDGHAALGLGVAEVLMEIRHEWQGTLKLIFQPAEEGVRGAKALVEKGHLDHVDYLIGAHISESEGYDGDFIPGSHGALATTKLDVVFHGKGAHAGSAPQTGRHVMLGVAAAISNLYGIPRTGAGASRINVGTLKAGRGRNIIADNAEMEIEVRGETSQINQYMEDYARRIIASSAQMHGLSCEIREMGSALTLSSDKDLIERVRTICRENLASVKVSSLDSMHFEESEDFSIMMKRVQEKGGSATFMRLLSPLADVLHGKEFDFDESCLIQGVKVFAAVCHDLLQDN